MHSSIRTEIKKTLNLALPLIGSQLTYSVSIFISTMFVAQLGQDALAASVLVNSIWITTSILFFGLLNSVSILVAHQFGANNLSNISKIMGQSFWLGLMVTILVILLLLNAPYLLKYAHQNNIVISYATDYLFSLTMTMPSLILLIIYEQFLAGINQARTVWYISLVVVPVEIPIIYCLIFGKFGLPTFGIAGIGVGYVLTYTLTVIGMTIYFLKSNHIKQFGVFRHVRNVDWSWLKELIHVGLPMGCMQLIEIGSFMIVAFWISQFGTTLLAAHQIVMQFFSFVSTIVFATSQAVTVRVAHAVGKLNLANVNHAIYVGMLIGFCFMFVVSLSFNFYPTLLLSIDINPYSPNNQQLVKDASELLGICGIFLILDNFRIIGFGALRGLKDTKFPMYVSLFIFGVVGLSLSYLLGFYFNLQGRGVWWGMTIAILIGALIILMRIYSLLQRIDSQKLLKIRL